jgi:hypothetical protein
MKQLCLSTEIYDRLKTQSRFTLQAIIAPACITILLFYVVTYFHSEISLLNGLPGVVILTTSAMVAVKLLFFTKLEKSELRRFGSILLGTFCFLIGEILYFYQQYFLRINVPYPSVADVPYLLGNLLFSYFLLSSLFSLIIRKRLNPLSIILASSVSIFPLYLVFSSAYNFSINLSSELDFIINSLYYAFDALMLIPALVILLNLEKKDQFIFHWIFITVALILLVIGDVGYTYFSIISESLIQDFEWLWSIVYALGYLFLGIGIYWFDRIKNILEIKNINAFLEMDEEDRLKNSSKNEIIGDKRSEYSEHIVGYENFVDKLEDFVERSKQIKILFYGKYWLVDEKVGLILDEIQQRAIVTPIQVSILVPITQSSFESLSYTDNRNILVSFFDRSLNSDSLVFIFDEKYVAILNKKLISKSVDNNAVFYGLITNKDTEVWSHVATFEKIRLVEKAVNL